jgi:hypothetical protein
VPDNVATFLFSAFGLGGDVSRSTVLVGGDVLALAFHRS